MVTLREWDTTSVALRLASRRGEHVAVEIAEKLIRRWAEDETAHAAHAVIRWVRVKAVLASMLMHPQSVH